MRNVKVTVYVPVSGPSRPLFYGEPNPDDRCDDDTKERAHDKLLKQMVESFGGATVVPGIGCWVNEALASDSVCTDRLAVITSWTTAFIYQDNWLEHLAPAMLRYCKEAEQVCVGFSVEQVGEGIDDILLSSYHRGFGLLYPEDKCKGGFRIQGMEG